MSPDGENFPHLSQSERLIMGWQIEDLFPHRNGGAVSRSYLRHLIRWLRSAR